MTQPSFSRRAKLTALFVGAGLLTVGAFTVPAIAGSRTSGSGGPITCNDGSVTWSPTTLWPPDHKMHTIAVSYSETDNDGDSLGVAVTGWSDNETVGGVELHGSGQPDPQQGPDVVPGSPGSGTDPGSAATTAQVRAERSGTGSGRVYTLQVTCTDMGGSSNENSQQTVDITVSVPHDQGHR